MPFGGWFDQYYDSIFRPAIEDAGLLPKRADDLYRPSAIVNDIWEYTKRAKLVLADLSGKNPNVFYELGLAHSLAKPAVLVTQSMDDIPFDLRALRVIEYEKSAPAWGQELKRKITIAISEVLESPLSAVLPSFLETSALNKRSVTGKEKEVIELQQEVALMRHELRRLVEEGSPKRGIPDPAEAESMIASFLADQVPAPLIVDRLVSKGVPASWVREKIAGLSRKPADGSEARRMLLAQIANRSGRNQRPTNKASGSSNKLTSKLAASKRTNRQITR